MNIIFFEKEKINELRNRLQHIQNNMFDPAKETFNIAVNTMDSRLCNALNVTMLIDDLKIELSVIEEAFFNNFEFLERLNDMYACVEEDNKRKLDDIVNNLVNHENMTDDGELIPDISVTVNRTLRYLFDNLVDGYEEQIKPVSLGRYSLYSQEEEGYIVSDTNERNIISKYLTKLDFEFLSSLSHVYEFFEFENLSVLIIDENHARSVGNIYAESGAATSRPPDLRSIMSDSTDVNSFPDGILVTPKVVTDKIGVSPDSNATLANVLVTPKIVTEKLDVTADGNTDLQNISVSTKIVTEKSTVIDDGNVDLQNISVSTKVVTEKLDATADGTTNLQDISASPKTVTEKSTVTDDGNIDSQNISASAKVVTGKLDVTAYGNTNLQDISASPKIVTEKSTVTDDGNIDLQNISVSTKVVTGKLDVTADGTTNLQDIAASPKIITEKSTVADDGNIDLQNISVSTKVITEKLASESSNSDIPSLINVNVSGGSQFGKLNSKEEEELRTFTSIKAFTATKDETEERVDFVDVKRHTNTVKEAIKEDEGHEDLQKPFNPTANRTINAPEFIKDIVEDPKLEDITVHNRSGTGKVDDITEEDETLRDVASLRVTTEKLNIVNDEDTTLQDVASLTKTVTEKVSVESSNDEGIEFVNVNVSGNTSFGQINSNGEEEVRSFRTTKTATFIEDETVERVDFIEIKRHTNSAKEAIKEDEGQDALQKPFNPTANRTINAPEFIEDIADDIQDINVKNRFNTEKLDVEADINTDLQDVVSSKTITEKFVIEADNIDLQSVEVQSKVVTEKIAHEDSNIAEDLQGIDVKNHFTTSKSDVEADINTDLQDVVSSKIVTEKFVIEADNIDLQSVEVQSKVVTEKIAHEDFNIAEDLQDINVKNRFTTEKLDVETNVNADLKDVISSKTVTEKIVIEADNTDLQSVEVQSKAVTEKIAREDFNNDTIDLTNVNVSGSTNFGQLNSKGEEQIRNFTTTKAFTFVEDETEERVDFIDVKRHAKTVKETIKEDEGHNDLQEPFKPKGTRIITASEFIEGTADELQLLEVAIRKHLQWEEIEFQNFLDFVYSLRSRLGIQLKSELSTTTIATSYEAIIEYIVCSIFEKVSDQESFKDEAVDLNFIESKNRKMSANIGSNNIEINAEPVKLKEILDSSISNKEIVRTLVGMNAPNELVHSSDIFADVESIFNSNCRRFEELAGKSFSASSEDFFVHNSVERYSESVKQDLFKNVINDISVKVATNSVVSSFVGVNPSNQVTVYSAIPASVTFDRSPILQQDLSDDTKGIDRINNRNLSSKIQMNNTATENHDENIVRVAATDQRGRKNNVDIAAKGLDENIVRIATTDQQGRKNNADIATKGLDNDIENIASTGQKSIKNNVDIAKGFDNDIENIALAGQKSIKNNADIAAKGLDGNIASIAVASQLNSKKDVVNNAGDQKNFEDNVVASVNQRSTKEDFTVEYSNANDDLSEYIISSSSATTLGFIGGLLLSDDEDLEDRFLRVAKLPSHVLEEVIKNSYQSGLIEQAKHLANMGDIFSILSGGKATVTTLKNIGSYIIG